MSELSLGLKLQPNYDRLNDAVSGGIFMLNLRRIKWILIFPILLIFGFLGGCAASKSGTQNQLGITPPPSLPTEVISPSPEPNKPVEGSESANMETLPSSVTAKITTSRGTITLKLYPESAPKTVKNFIAKANAGYYNGLTFHRVEDWVIQGGDPKGDGTGGGDQPTELSQVPFKAGSLGVARAGDIKVSNDSQFFICTSDCAWLTGQYTNFGEVTDGMEIAKTTQIGDKIVGIKIEE
jgi:peptidyl-prolyl cis-trans isomerase B (cyclophilin B)